MVTSGTQTFSPSIRKNDQVQVISGREKGKTGKVLEVDQKSGRITVEKINLMKRHVKPTQKNPSGGIVEKEQSLHYSNIQLFCAKCNRGVRHGHKWVEKSAGKKKKKGAETVAPGRPMKVRVCKRCNESLDVA